jgi:beta-glucanase (GH16 family)
LGVPLAQHEGIAQMIEHNHLLYQDMQDPLQFLNNAWSGGMAEYWPYAHQQTAPLASPQAEVDKFTRYSQLMAASQGFVVQEILSSYFFDEHRCVLDVGTHLVVQACENVWPKHRAMSSNHNQWSLTLVWSRVKISVIDKGNL